MSMEIRNMADVMLRKEKAYRDGIAWNKSQSLAFASRLASGGTLEGLLGQEAIESYRETLKDIAEQNVEKDRQLNAYLQAVKKLGSNTSVSLHCEDIQQQMEQAVLNERKTLDQHSILPAQESFYLELCKELGETQGEEDDEIAVVQTEPNINDLKCPITATLMEDPVRNKVCKHSYSKAAILQHIRVREKSCPCPVPACTNNRVTKSQLEPDDRTALLIRRLKKREELNQRSQQISQATDVDMDDEEE